MEPSGTITLNFLFSQPYFWKKFTYFCEAISILLYSIAMNTKFLLSSDNNNRNELLKKKIIHNYIANGDATIADLGREMDLSIPTVTKLVAELQDDGYILDLGKQATNGGRKPNIYGLNPASGYFVGVDMLQDK